MKTLDFRTYSNFSPRLASCTMRLVSPKIQQAVEAIVGHATRKVYIHIACDLDPTGDMHAGSTFKRVADRLHLDFRMFSFVHVLIII